VIALYNHFHFLLFIKGNESLKDRYKQEPKLSFIIKAIYTMAYALEKLQKDACGTVKGICPAMYPFNGTLFLVSIDGLI
jgi:hypothetical protein